MFNLTKPPCFNLSLVDKLKVLFVLSVLVEAVLQVNISVRQIIQFKIFIIKSDECYKMKKTNELFHVICRGMLYLFSQYGL